MNFVFVGHFEKKNLSIENLNLVFEASSHLNLLTTYLTKMKQQNTVFQIKGQLSIVTSERYFVPYNVQIVFFYRFIPLHFFVY